MDRTNKRAIRQEKALWRDLAKKLLDRDHGDAGGTCFDLNLRGENLRRYLELKNYRDHCKNPNFQRLPPDHPLRRRG